MSHLGDPATSDEDGGEDERAGLGWALRDLDRLHARGLVGTETYNALRADYQARLRALLVPPSAPGPQHAAQGASTRESPVAAIAVEQAAPGAASLGEATAPAVVTVPPAEPPPGVPSSQARQPGAAGGGFADLWINILLYLGAFFVVIAALIFVSYSWRQLGGGAKTAIVVAFTLTFLGAGALCLRVQKVRVAGHTFLAIGALLTPLDIVALYTFVLRQRGLSGASILAWGALYCAIFYGALALGGLGRLYGFGAVLSVIVAWGGAFVALDLPTAWALPGVALLPVVLLVGGRLGERTSAGRRAFGPLPAITAHVLMPVACFAIAAVAASGNERASVVTALALVLGFYTGSAETGAPGFLRDAQRCAALTVATAFACALGYNARVPHHWYAAILLGVAWFDLGLAVFARRWKAGWDELPLLFGAGQVGLLVLPWGFFVADGHAAYWIALFAGTLLTSLLGLWRSRLPWLIYPVALAAALTLYHALRLAFVPLTPERAAWGYALLALPFFLGLRVARRRGLSHDVDLHLAISGQALGLAAVLLASQSRPQFAALLWLFAAANAWLVLVELRAVLLALPSLWALAAVGATLSLLGVERRWGPAVFAGIGLAIALGLQGWRVAGGVRASPWFAAHRWVAGGWAALGPLLGLWLLGEAVLRFLASGELLELVLDPAYGPVSLAVALCGAALAADAVVTLRRPTGYGASAVVATAVLMGIARVTPNNPQAYAVPLGIYLLTLSVYVAYERELGAIRMLAANSLLTAAVTVILGTTWLQSLVHPWRYVLLGLVEGLILLVVTLFLRRRYGVALSLLFLVLTALRALFDAARSLPNWAVIGLLGLGLLGGGLFVLLRRDRFDAWGAAATTRWSRLI